jgi:hypothetical protein
VVVDLKTAEPGPAAIERYSRQLHAYALALEHPASGPATTVSGLGLLCFDPHRYHADGARASLVGDVHWLEVPRDDDGFLEFLADVVGLLEQGAVPLPAVGCPWCSWRGSADAST